MIDDDTIFVSRDFISEFIGNADDSFNDSTGDYFIDLIQSNSSIKRSVGMREIISIIILNNLRTNKTEFEDRCELQQVYYVR